MKKKILIIIGNPYPESFCNALANAYEKGALDTGADVRNISLGTLSFDPVLWKGYREIQQLEPDLEYAQQLIDWADHLVFVYPTWWASMPALLKGFIDRVFLPGFAFKFDSGLLPRKLLKGKSARLIVTMNAPVFVYRWIIGSPGNKLMKRGLLHFCGISPVSITQFGRVEVASLLKHEKMLRKAERLGRNQL